MSSSWRYTCPSGHRSWEARSSRGEYWCTQCETAFQQLRDQKQEAGR